MQQRRQRHHEDLQNGIEHGGDGVGPLLLSLRQQQGVEAVVGQLIEGCKARYQKEIVKANVQTMKVILSPKAAYRPAVVRLQVPLEEASSRVLLSNSITLTPGTVTIRQHEEEFLVLCLDKDGGEAIPDWNLVRILKKLEGSK